MAIDAKDANVVVGRTSTPDTPRLRRVLQDLTSPELEDVLAELDALRDVIANPLGSQDRGPNPEDRQKLQGAGDVVVMVPSSGFGNEEEMREVRLSADLISVALALASELQMNEMDAAVLLYDARTRAAQRPDGDVVAAAKDIYCGKRLEQILYVQELLRAPLSDSSNQENTSDAFASIITERDLLVANGGVVTKILDRLELGLDAMHKVGAVGSREKDQLLPYEASSLAECVFLAAYTLQMTAAEAIRIRTALKKADEVVTKFEAAIKQKEESQRWTNVEAQASALKSRAHLEAISVQNLLFLSWVCALDRSRYQDVYDPREKNSSVNKLLLDEQFIRRTITLPAFSEDERLPYTPAVAASELTGAIFRLATRSPDEDEATFSALRVCVHADALRYLSTDLPGWISSCLSQDVDLYGDAFEDLVLDVTEASSLVASLLEVGLTDKVQSLTETPSEIGYTPSPQHTSGAKPPLAGKAYRSPAPAETSGLYGLQPPKTSQPELDDLGASVILELCAMVEHAITLAPLKLQIPSAGGGLKYWTAVGDGGLGGGILPRIADTLSEAAETAEASGVDDERLTELVHAFLRALKASCVSAPHSYEAFGILRGSTYKKMSLRWAFDALHQLYRQPRPVNLPSEQRDEHLRLEWDLCVILEVAGAMGQTAESGAVILDVLAPRELASATASAFVSNAVGSRLRGALVSTLVAMGDWHAIAAFVDGLCAGNCAALLRSFREESERGEYHGTMAFLNACKKAVTGGEETARILRGATERVCKEFVIDSVLSGWPRRKYSDELGRWSLFELSVDLLLAVITSDPNMIGVRLVSHILIPAPATGAASQPLRAILGACGVQRSPDENERENDLPGLFRLRKAAENQDAKLYHGLEQCAGKAAKLLTHALSLSQARIVKQGLSGATCIELIAGEAKCLSTASTLIYQPDLSNFVMYSAGYDPVTVDAVIDMLGSAARQSSLVAHSITQSNSTSLSKAPAMLRTNLAHMVRAYCGEAKDGQHQMTRILRLVESCLGTNGGGTAGLYLLGVRLDANGRLKSMEYGVLDSIISSLADVPDARSLEDGEPLETLDLKCHAIAAVFLEKLATYAVQEASVAVLECLRSYPGFATHLLQKMVRYAESNEYGDWGPVGLIAGAGISLAALHLHRFGASAAITADFPSPGSLLNLVDRIAESKEFVRCLDVLNKWRMLFTVQFDTGSARMDDEGIFLVAGRFIDSLVIDKLRSGSSTGLHQLVEVDGGEVLAYSALTLITNLTQQGNSNREHEILVKILQAATTLASSRVDSPRTRCALYTCVAILGGVVLRCANDGLPSARGRREAEIPLSHIDEFVSVACNDAVAGPSAAEKAAAMVALSIVTRLDSKAAVPALARNNRLRRVLSNSLCESGVIHRIVQACTQSPSKKSGLKMENARAAIVIAQAGISVIHAVAAAADGTRALADGACIECASSVLTALDKVAGTGETYESKARTIGRSMVTTDDESYLLGEPDSCSAFEQRVSIVGSLAAAISAAVVNSNTNLVDGALTAVESGKSLFEEVFKSQKYKRIEFLQAAAAVAMILSRIPDDIVASVAVTMHLKAVAAQTLEVYLPLPPEECGASRSPFSAGIQSWIPSTPREGRRSIIEHPEGGSLFERDVVRARINCLRNLLSSLRCTTDLTATFRPCLGRGEDGDSDEDMQVNGTSFGGPSQRGSLLDILRISSASLTEARRNTEEAVRVLSLADGDALAARSPKQLKDIRVYCCEEFGYSAEEMDGDVLLSCLKRCSEQARDLGESCLYIMESSLFILKEFAAMARQAVTGKSYKEGYVLRRQEAEELLQEAKQSLLPLCRFVDALPEGVWGEHDSSFAKQLGRRIRTSVGG